jgi:hypothetical protein
MITKEELVQTILVSTAQFQSRFDKDSKPDVMKRQAILDSEVSELIQAIKENNIVEILDGFVDILYVLGGSFDKFQNDNEQANLYLDWIDVRIKQALKYFSLECLNDALIDIHNSNMSKVHIDLFQVIDTIKKYGLDSDNFRVKRISEMEYFVYDLNINKLLKPLNYKKANLKPILEKYGYL